MSIRRSLLRSASELAIVGAGIYVFERALAHQRGEAPTINWNRVRTVARRVAQQPSAVAIDLHPATVHSNYAVLVAQAQPLITDYTHTELPQNLTEIIALSRQQWLDTNIASFIELFAPLEDAYRQVAQRFSEQSITPLMSMLGGWLLSSQLGLLLGYLARRVLGQYDFALLGREPVTTGKLYFIDENIAFVERRLGVPPDQFRLWIALHEATHAFEFEAHPWLASYLNERVKEHMHLLVQQVERMPLVPDVDGMIRMVQRAIQHLSTGSHLVELFLDDRQQQLFRRLQGIMSLLEGYSNHVMDAIGIQLLPDYLLIKQRFEARQLHRSRLDRLWLRLSGLDMKMEQYILGEAFVTRVVQQRGMDFLNRAFTAPEYLPDVEEIREPERWISRIERLVKQEARVSLGEGDQSSR
ncbi:MAG: zinc-dependent metalloprotease [Chloroflexi bacterium]|nr:zinc-dependent metalloprotease [Chloroflexota bacterium]